MPGFAFFDLSCLPRFSRRLSITMYAPGLASRALGELLRVVFDRLLGLMFAFGSGSGSGSGSGEGSTPARVVPSSPASWKILRRSRLGICRVPSSPRRIDWQRALIVNF